MTEFERDLERWNRGDATRVIGAILFRQKRLAQAIDAISPLLGAVSRKLPEVADDPYYENLRVELESARSVLREALEDR